MPQPGFFDLDERYAKLNVPDPARFAIHKLVISQRRRAWLRPDCAAL